jgi:hypothetical protein
MGYALRAGGLTAMIRFNGKLSHRKSTVPYMLSLVEAG